MTFYALEQIRHGIAMAWERVIRARHVFLDISQHRRESNVKAHRN